MPKTAVRLLIFVSVLLGSSAHAFDLNGAWTTNRDSCAKIFETKNGKISFAYDSDFFGSGFIIEGNQMRGPAKTCRIINRKEEGGTLHLIASCTTDIAVLGTQEVSAKIDGDDKITRIYPEFPDMGISFYRCKP